MSIKKKVIIFIVFNATLLFIPWLNALTSNFVLQGDFDDRNIKFIGSHGRYKMEANYSSDLHIVHTGYYASLFDTLYLFQVRRDKVAGNSVFDLNEFIRSQQNFILLKLSHEQGNVYELKHIEEDPRKGIVKHSVIVNGDLGLL
ncbi:hypothetical protein [Vibrio parahaemolyticus]|uniref:hypothetical protein n=1 Tax=Vibrio parahaemolyticus TaxID=670 RepID=UPI003872AD61